MRNLSKLNITQRFNKTFSLVSPQSAEMIAALASMSRGDIEEDEKVALHKCAAGFGTSVDDRKPFIFADGIAVIPVYGVLLHRDDWCSSYATGYDYISSRFDAAVNDPDVKGIVFDVDSHGGQVNGNFELCDRIYTGRSKKPSIAIVDAMAYSGGYSIATSAGKLVAAPDSGVGSIGVVMMHVSYEKALDEMGIGVTYIYAGKHKVDGNPYKDLSDSAKERFQASVDRSYKKFVALVSRNRALETEAVRATEALCYDAEDALPLGLIDGISTSKDALVAFRNELKGSTSTSKKGASSMSNNTAAPGAEDGQQNAVAPAASTIDTAKITADAKTAGANEAKARIAAITGCDEAKDRSKLANHIAFNTEMSVDDAKAMLGAAQVEKSADAAPARRPFDAAMDATGQPNVGASDGSNGGDGQTVSVGQRILGNYGAATGIKVGAQK